MSIFSPFNTYLRNIRGGIDDGKVKATSVGLNLELQNVS